MAEKTVAIRVYRDVDFEVKDGIETELPFTHARFGLFSPSTKLVAPSKGIYLINAQCIWRSSNHGNDTRCLDVMWQLTIKINGKYCIATDRQYYNSWPPFNHCGTIWQMEKGDYVEMVVFWYKPEGVQMTSWVRRAEHLDSPEFMMCKLGDC